MVSYADAVVAMTVMCVLLVVLPVCILRECKGAGETAMLVCGGGGWWGWWRCGCGECRACEWYTFSRYCV